jgi:RHS repeat-associated protein
LYGRTLGDPYGAATFLNATTWATLTGSAHGWVYLHQGGRYDANAKLYHFRSRDLSPSLGRWMQNDPAGYAAGDTNLYRDLGNRPMGLLDPTVRAGQREEPAEPACGINSACKPIRLWYYK